MEIDCRADMQTAKRLVMEAISDIVNGEEFDADDLNDLHHALEALEIIQRIECKDTPAPAPETPPANGGGGGGNTTGGTDLTGIMAGMERLLGMVAQLVTAVAGKGNGGAGSGASGADSGTDSGTAPAKA